jgi:hypothetical protein
VRLIGTVIEAEGSYAIFADAAGATRLIRVGEKIDSAELVAVEEGAVTVLVGGQEMTLTRDKESSTNP